VLRKAVFCALLFPMLLPSQRPAMPGKLNVTSTPAGAPITMDQAATNRYTPSLFVVSAGNHTVALGGEAGKQCGAPAKVDVDPGANWTVNCDKSGWHTDRKTK
jgi:hypothetical protein